MEESKRRENGTEQVHATNRNYMVHVPRTSYIGSEEDADACVMGLEKVASWVGAKLSDFGFRFAVYPKNFNNNGRAPRYYLTYKTAQSEALSDAQISMIVDRVPKGVMIDYLSPADPSKMHTYMFRPAYAGATRVQFAL